MKKEEECGDYMSRSHYIGAEPDFVGHVVGVDAELGNTTTFKLADGNKVALFMQVSGCHGHHSSYI